MKAWVIKRDDGWYYQKGEFNTDIFSSDFYDSKEQAQDIIDLWEYEDCQPVQTTITEGDNKENSYIIGGRFNGKQYMTDLKAENKQLKKALELACIEYTGRIKSCSYCVSQEYCRQFSDMKMCYERLSDYFKAKAKEEEKDE